MKLVPDGLSRALTQQGFLASKNAPKILFVGGVIGMVGSTVLACRATLKLEEVLDEIDHDQTTAREIKAKVSDPQYQGEASYSDKELQKDLASIKTKGILKVARLYAPSVLLGGISIFALTKSHNILQDRNLALTAAYAAVEGAYARYRYRVVERYGEEVDQELFYEAEKVEVLDDETGKIISEINVIGAPGAAYQRFYDEVMSTMYMRDPDANIIFLRGQQNYLNERLRIRGHVFLNEVYERLGLAPTKAGSVVGWLWTGNKETDYIDFGIWDGDRMEIRDFFYGREDTILLTFNPQGVIWHQLDESDHEGEDHNRALSRYDR